jgi:Skp family chaperone for outer membrane proteins
MGEAELLSAILGSLLTILASLASLAYWLGRKFAQIDARFKAVEGSVNALRREFDEKLSSLERRYDEKLGLLEERFDGKLSSLEKSFDEKLSSLERRFDEKLSMVERKVGSVAEAARNQLEFFTEFLGYKRVISWRDVTFVKGELYRLSAAPNPLTKEEAARLKELLDKEKLTLEEADELREIARKLVKEYGDRVGETWKLLIYASIMRGLALSELEEPEGGEESGQAAA